MELEPVQGMQYEQTLYLYALPFTRDMWKTLMNEMYQACKSPGKL